MCKGGLNKEQLIYVYLILPLYYGQSDIPDVYYLNPALHFTIVILLIALMLSLHCYKCIIISYP